MREATAAVEAQLAGWLPRGTGFGLVPLDSPLPQLLPGEGEAVAGAVPRRRAEFAAGRAAARRALAAAELPQAPLPADAQRVPRWPAGAVGSIAHAGALAVAIAGRGADWRGLGIDLEPAGALAPELSAAVLSPADVAALDGGDPTRGFCAKEAVQKALWPATRTLLDFGDVALAPGPDGTLEARLRRRLDGVAAGRRFAVRVAEAGGYVLALCLWPAAVASSAESFAASAAAS